MNKTKIEDALARYRAAHESDPGLLELLIFLVTTPIDMNAFQGVEKDRYTWEIYAAVTYLLFFTVFQLLPFWIRICGLTFASIIPTMVILEILVDMVYAFKHRFHTAPSIKSSTTDWKPITIVRSSNNGFGARQFYPAIVRDFNILDDPFAPDHVSLVYMIEIRRRCFMWRSMIIWQVSILNGGQKKLHEFNRVFTWRTDNFLERSIQRPLIECFQSAGVILIFSYDGKNWLYVYDMRYKKSNRFYFTNRMTFSCERPIFAKCLHPLWNGNGELIGWKIRTIINGSYAHEDEYAFGGNPIEDEQMPIWPQRRRTRLINSVIDCRDDIPWEDDTLLALRFVRNRDYRSQDEIIYSDHASYIRSRRVGTSSGLIGLYAENKFLVEGPTMLYDESNDKYVFYSNFDQMLKIDRPLATYIYTPAPNDQVHNANLCPTVLSRREIISCFEDGSIFRSEIAPSTLKFLAAKALFRSSPGLRYRMMSAQQFRQLYGGDGMDGHFG